MKTRDEIEKLLEDKIPRDAVATRDGGGGKRLSYLETWYVIAKMNEIFGNLGWDQETVEMREIPDQDKPTYVARVRITVTIPGADKYASVTHEGTGYGRDKSGMNPHEMATKEAESDAFKRAAMKFGNSLGLALYNKDQDGVEDGQETQTKPVASKVSSTPASSPVAPVGAVPAQPRPAVQPGATSGGPAPTRDAVLKSISQYSKVAIDKKVLTLEAAKDMLKGYGASTKEELNDQQAAELLGKLKEVLK